MQRVNKFRMKLLKNTLTALANWEDKEKLVVMHQYEIFNEASKPKVFIWSKKYNFVN